MITAYFRPHICPYCFETFRLRDTPFRCTSPMARCAPQTDEVRARLWQENTLLGPVLPPPGGFKRETPCPACNQISQKRLCPHCHMDLPHTIGRYRHLIFAVIGAKEAGKSHYLAVLIDQIRRHIGPALNILLEPLNDDTMRRYRTDFYDPLFNQGHVINVTRSALSDRRVQRPLMYSLSLAGKNLFGRPTIRGVVTLVFFDTAGEDLDSEDTMAAVNKYIYRAQGIVVLFDPLQLPAVRARLKGSVSLPQSNTETADILLRTTNLVRRGRRMPLDKIIDTPMAVAFSKFDAVEPLLDPQLQLHAESRHDSGFDIADHEAVQAEMRSLLSEWDGNVLQHQLETHYRRFSFFGLSALGCNPGIEKKVPRILPRRVEDPFLWLLHCHRLIPARRPEGRL